MSTRDEQIGRNLATLRGEMSQKELAARMKDLGWKWSQATVWSVEAGERPLRLSEAQDVASVLGLGLLGVERLTRPFGDAVVALHVREVIAAHTRLKEAITDFRESQLQLSVAADQNPPTTGFDQMQVRSWLETHPSKIAQEVSDRQRAEAEVEMKLTGLDPAAAGPDAGTYVQTFERTWADGEHQEEA